MQIIYAIFKGQVIREGFGKISSITDWAENQEMETDLDSTRIPLHLWNLTLITGNMS